MLMILMHRLIIGLAQLLNRPLDVLALFGEDIVDVDALLIQLIQVLILLMNLLGQGGHLVSESLLNNLLGLQYFSHSLPLLFALDLLVKDLQFCQHDRFYILEALQKALLCLFLPFRPESDIVLHLLNLQLLALHLFLGSLDLGDVILLKRLQRAGQLRNLLHDLRNWLLGALLLPPLMSACFAPSLLPLAAVSVRCCASASLLGWSWLARVGIV